jgi:hypothetical protein
MTKLSLQWTIFASIILSSCTVSKISGIYKTRTNKTSDIQRTSISAYPLIVDLNVDMSIRVTGASSGEIAKGLTEEYFRELALAEAMVKSGADILVEPIYSVTKNFTGTGAIIKTTVEVSVTGYVGKYKNPRNITSSDTSMIQFVRGTMVKENSAQKNNPIQLLPTPTKIY